MSKRYKGTIKEILTEVFREHPDCYVVNGTSRGSAALCPWAHVVSPVGYVHNGDNPRETGVVVTPDQFYELEALYLYRFNVRIKYLLDVHDKDTDVDLVSSKTY